MMNTTNFPGVVGPLMNMVFDGEFDQLKEEFSSIFKVENGMKRRYEEEPVLAGLGAAVEKGEGSNITYDTGGEAFVARYIFRNYGIGYAMTEELVDDGEHIKIGAVFSRHAAVSLKHTTEIVAANIFNNAFTAAFPGGDAQPLVSNAHPLYGGGTVSNILATPANLSESTLEELSIQIRQAVNLRGLNIALGINKLVVAPRNMFVARRLLNSPLRTGTADNDINALKDMGLFSGGAQVLTRLTNPNAFFVLTDAPEGLKFKDRGLKSEQDGDFDSGNIRSKWTRRFAVGWTNYLSTFATQGL